MRIIINGACGRMGKALGAVLAETQHEIAARVDVNAAEPGVLTKLADAPEADVVIDFSHHSAVCALLDFCESRKLPVVICTTGHDDAELARIADAAKQISVFHSGNMSVGVALLCRMAKDAARLFPEADVEIVETHHKHKLDAPSGTAKMLFESVREARPDAVMACGRSGMSPRTPQEVGIQSVRRGEIVGIHEVHITSATQSLTLRHEAFSRSLFAEGAVCAAEFLVSQPAGLYDMKSLI